MRDALVAAHLALVDRVASKLACRLPMQIDAEDLVSAGHIGLLDAARSFDAARGVPFGAYARRRVLGAMLDSLRDADSLTRHQRARVRSGRAHHFEIQLHMDDADHVRQHGLDALVSEEPQPDVVLAKLLQAEHVRSAVNALPRRERFVVVEYFWRQRQLADIGASLGVGEARASQLKKQGCDRLRRLLAC